MLLYPDWWLNENPLHPPPWRWLARVKDIRPCYPFMLARPLEHLPCLFFLNFISRTQIHVSIQRSDSFGRILYYCADNTLKHKKYIDDHVMFRFAVTETSLIKKDRDKFVWSCCARHHNKISIVYGYSMLKVRYKLFMKMFFLALLSCNQICVINFSVISKYYLIQETSFERNKRWRV